MFKINTTNGFFLFMKRNNIVGVHAF